MSILPDFMIRALEPDTGRHVVEPWSERSIQNGMSYGLSCAGYDVRSKQPVLLQPDEFFLLSTVEHFWMPDNLIATVKDKSTWARRGLSVFNTIIEPGWRGWLTIEVVNHSREPVKVCAGDPIAQVVFETMLAPAERPYKGKYQDQADRPVVALAEVQS